MNDLIEKLSRECYDDRLTNPRDRATFMALQELGYGHSVKVVADCLGMPESTTRRVLQRLKARGYEVHIDGPVQPRSEWECDRDKLANHPGSIEWGISPQLATYRRMIRNRIMRARKKKVKSGKKPVDLFWSIRHLKGESAP